MPDFSNLFSAPRKKPAEGGQGSRKDLAEQEVCGKRRSRLKKRGVRLPADARKMSLAPTRRREEDVRRLRLESVVPRGGTVRVFGLGVRASLARTSGECRISQISSPRHEKSPPRAGRSVAQRRGFEPPDESPPSHDFQSCSLNHSDISAKPCNHIIFPQKRQLILRAFRQKVFGNFLIPPMRRRHGKKREKHASKRVKSCKKAEEFDIRLCRGVLSCYTVREQYEPAFSSRQDASCGHSAKPTAALFSSAAPLRKILHHKILRGLWYQLCALPFIVFAIRRYCCILFTAKHLKIYSPKVRSNQKLRFCPQTRQGPQTVPSARSRALTQYRGKIRAFDRVPIIPLQYKIREGPMKIRNFPAPLDRALSMV